MQNDKIKIREIEAFEELEACLDVQREVFGFSETEVSPTRHHIVTKHAGGFMLGAFDDKKLVGLALTVPAFRGNERIFYSHMAAVLREYQSYGIGAGLKWAQREKALSEGVKFIKWTFQPVQARNAFFNLEKLGAVIRKYMPNFYGAGFSNTGHKTEIESDRLFAEWELESDKVISLLKGEKYVEKREVELKVVIPSDWNNLLNTDPIGAKAEQERIKTEFEKAFANGLVCRGFERDQENPAFILFRD